MRFYQTMQKSPGMKAIMQKKLPKMALAHAMLEAKFDKREAILASYLPANEAARALAALPAFLDNRGERRAVHRAPLNHKPLEHVAPLSPARSSPPAPLKRSSPQRPSPPPPLKRVSPVRSSLSPRLKNASPARSTPSLTAVQASRTSSI